MKPVLIGVTATALLASAGPDRDARPVPAFVRIDAGWNYACALASDGSAWCWGTNAMGTLGTTTTGTCKTPEGREPCALGPVKVATNVNFISLTTGDFHACGLAADGMAWCWGENWLGQLGAASSDRCKTVSEPEMPCARTPRRVAADSPFVAIEAGRYHTCALTASGKAYCWGANGDGQIRSFAPASRCGTELKREQDCYPVPTAVELPEPEAFTTITAGGFHTCAVERDGDLRCWGKETPERILVQGEPLKVKAVDADYASTLALGSDGALYWWGRSVVGTTLGQIHEPGRVDLSDGRKGALPFTGITAFDAGPGHSCATTEGGKAWCWGWAEGGELAKEMKPPPNMPKGQKVLMYVGRPGPDPVAAEALFMGIAAGPYFSCAVTDTGVAWCWGANNLGQLGDGTTEARWRPAAVAAAAVAASSR